MIKHIANIFLFFLILYITILFNNSGIWLLAYIELFVILALVRLSRGDIVWGCIFIVIGTTMADILSFQIVGLTALFAVFTLMIFRIVSRFVALLDHQSSEMKVVLVFILFHLISSIYYYGQSIFNLKQIVWVGILNLLILSIFLIVSYFIKRSRNAFKI